MTVGELREQLAKLPTDTEIYNGFPQNYDKLYKVDSVDSYLYDKNSEDIYCPCDVDEGDRDGLTKIFVLFGDK